MRRKYRSVVAVLCLLLAMTLCLSGCMIIPISAYYVIPPGDVVSVQFYDLSGLPTWDVTFGFDMTEQEPFFVLPEEDKTAFLEDFSHLEFSDTILLVLAAIDPSFSYGRYVVRIDFTDGDFTYYSTIGYGESYDREGNFKSSTNFSCDEDELVALMERYCQALPEVDEP